MNCPQCRAPISAAQPFCSGCGASLGPALPVAPDASAAGGADDSTRFSPYKPDALESGTTFAGRYQIVEELGRGGMGRVYKVIDLEIHGKVALKLIRPEIALDPAAIGRFRQELTTARGISHKNICRMHDLGRDGTTYFLTMEYVSGQDLKTVIGMTGQLGVGTAISIAKQVCDGLAEAHRLGVIHRDLKPQNIQIDKGGQAKIMDFGIARSAVVKGVTDAGMAVGTPQYMSPEQAEARSVDARSDLYALGVILYEMLTGRVPFDADTPLAVAMKHKLEAPRDPRELNASIPADLSRLILKCLEKDAAARYQSAGEVHADLVRIEQGLPTSAQVVPQPPLSTSKQITLPFTMRQLWVPLLVGLAVVAVGITAWRLWPKKAASEPAAGGTPTIALLYCENNSGDPTLSAWRTNLPELLTTSLSQSSLLNVVSSERMFTILKRLNLADAKRFSTDDLAAVARDGRAQYVLTCSVMKAGQNTVITATLQKAATAEPVRPPRMIELAGGETLAKIDELAAHIKADLNLSAQALSRESAQPLGQVLTSSPEALKYYSEARRLHLSSGCRYAVSQYQQAIDADPAFAMAYRGLSSCYNTLGERAKQLAAASKALSLSDKLPERFRYHIQLTAWYTSTTTYPQAIEAGNALLARFPDDDIGLNYLSLIYCEAEEYEKCVPLREAAARVSPSLLTVGNLWAAYAQLGRSAELKRSIEQYLERDPNSAPAHYWLGQFYQYSGQPVLAQREWETALRLAPGHFDTHVAMGDAAWLRGDFAEAEREFVSTLEQGTEANKLTARGRIGALYVTQGQFERIMALLGTEKLTGSAAARQGSMELEAGTPALAATTFQRLLADPAFVSNQKAALDAFLGLGLSYVATGDAGKAQKAFEDLKHFPQGVFVKLKNRVSLALSGAIAAQLGKGPSAIAELTRAVSMLEHRANFIQNSQSAAVLNLLANAYEVAGDLTKARETYEQITALTTGRMAWGATYARSFYHLGLIAEKQGDRARARERFGKFLDLWKHADPGQPDVADARRRMR